MRAMCGVQLRQTDTTVLNLVVSQETEGGQIHLNVTKAFDLHKLKLTQKDDFLKHKYFTGSMPLLTTIYKKCGVKTSSEKMECYILKTHLELHYLWSTAQRNK